MTQDGINLHVTPNGKILLVAQKGEDSVSFVLSHETAKEFRNEFQSVLSQVDPLQDNREVET